MLLPFVIRNKMVSDLNIKLGEYVNFESGFSNQNKLKNTEKNILANKKGFAYGTKIIANTVRLFDSK